MSGSTTDWTAAYRAWRKAGIGIKQFHQTELVAFCHGPKPTLDTTYHQFIRIRKQPPYAQVRVVALTEDQVKKAIPSPVSPARHAPTRRPVESAEVTLEFRGGTRLSIPCSDPCVFAAKLVQLMGAAQ